LRRISVLDPRSSDGIICVRSISRDGRYSANIAYTIGLGQRSGGPLPLNPLTKRYDDVLTSYPEEQIAIRAFLAVDQTCSPAGALNLPILTGAEQGSDKLVVDVNGKSQAARTELFELSDSGDEAKALASAVCDRAGSGALISFDLVCTLRLPKMANQRVRLELDLDDGFDVTSYTFDLLLAAGDG